MYEFLDMLQFSTVRGLSLERAAVQRFPYSAQQLIEHAQRMREEGLLAEGGRVFATHIAHEGNPVHPELVDFAAQHGYEVAYDGLRV